MLHEARSAWQTSAGQAWAAEAQVARLNEQLQGAGALLRGAIDTDRRATPGNLQEWDSDGWDRVNSQMDSLIEGDVSIVGGTAAGGGLQGDARAVVGLLAQTQEALATAERRAVQVAADAQAQELAEQEMLLSAMEQHAEAEAEADRRAALHAAQFATELSQLRQEHEAGVAEAQREAFLGGHSEAQQTARRYTASPPPAPGLDLLRSRALSNSAVDRRVLWNQLPEFVKD